MVTTATRTGEYLPTNLIRVGSFEGDLEKVLAAFNPKFYKRASQSNIQAYGFFYAGKSPYLLNVSNEKRAITNPEDYNTLLIITSHSYERNQQVVQEFQDATGIDFQRIMPIIRFSTLAKLRNYGLIFDILLDNPDEAMKLLRELERRTI